MITLILMIFLGLWLFSIAYLAGYISTNFLPQNFSNLALPTTTQLGDSLSILDGIFTSIAILLGLVAILLQGKELKESTRAQTLQAKSLEKQIIQQKESNQLGAYTVRLTYLVAEADRLENQITSLLKITKDKNKDSKAISEAWKIIKNSRNLQLKGVEEIKDIDNKIKVLLG